MHATLALPLPHRILAPFLFRLGEQNPMNNIGYIGIGLLLLLVTSITGCGQTGPLYLPPAEDQAAER